MLLAIETGCCTFDQSALDILPMDTSDTSTLRDSSACLVFIRLSCSSLDEFVRRFSVHCASEYQHWRNEEVTKQNTKKLSQAPLMEQISSISFMCRMSVLNALASAFSASSWRWRQRQWSQVFLQPFTILLEGSPPGFVNPSKTSGYQIRHAGSEGSTWNALLSRAPSAQTA